MLTATAGFLLAFLCELVFCRSHLAAPADLIRT
jgi:hypothetical protein